MLTDQFRHELRLKVKGSSWNRTHYVEASVHDKTVSYDRRDREVVKTLQTYFGAIHEG